MIMKANNLYSISYLDSPYIPYIGLWVDISSKELYIGLSDNIPSKANKIFFTEISINDIQLYIDGKLDLKNYLLDKKFYHYNVNDGEILNNIDIIDFDNLPERTKHHIEQSKFYIIDEDSDEIWITTILNRITNNQKIEL